MIKHSVFVYGTLKRGGPNHDLYLGSQCSGTAKFRCAAVTRCSWPLVIASKYNIPYLLAAKGTGHQIKGEVFDVDQVTLDALDGLEGHPEYYERSVIDVHLLHNLPSQSETVSSSTSSPTTSSSASDTVSVGCYFLKRFHPKLLNLPFQKEFKFTTEAYPPYVSIKDRITDGSYCPRRDVMVDG